MKKKILMLLSNPFLPDPRPLKEAKLLIKNGYTVKLLAWNRDIKNVLPEKETVEGIEIVRINKLCGYRNGLKSIFKFISFYNVLIQKIKEEKEFDLIYCHDFDTLLPAVIANLSRKTFKIVLDSHEQYEGMFTRNTNLKSKIMHTMVIALKKLLYGKVSFFIFVTDEMKKIDEKIIGRLIINSEIICNYPEKDFRKIKEDDTKSDVINICYFGNVRDTEIIISIAEAVEKTKNINFHVAGMGKSAPAIESSFSNLKRSFYHGPFNSNTLSKLYINMDMVSCLYKIDDSNRLGFPVKFYEAMVLGLPVMAFKNTILGDYLTLNDIGFVLKQPDDINSFITETLTLKRIEYFKSRLLSFEDTKQFIFESQEDAFLKGITSL